MSLKYRINNDFFTVKKMPSDIKIMGPPSQMKKTLYKRKMVLRYFEILCNFSGC